MNKPEPRPVGTQVRSGILLAARLTAALVGCVFAAWTIGAWLLLTELARWAAAIVCGVVAIGSMLFAVTGAPFKGQAVSDHQPEPYGFRKGVDIAVRTVLGFVAAYAALTAVMGWVMGWLKPNGHPTRWIAAVAVALAAGWFAGRGLPSRAPLPSKNEPPKGANL